jgi:membrane fusion protein (multidrug efflux system)
VPIYREWIGSLDGLVNASIRAQVSGYLRSQDYREGVMVREGDLLFEIDPRPFEAVLAQAQAQLAQAEAQEGKTLLDVKRYTPLADQNAISRQELDDAIQANLAAKAQVAAARAAVDQAKLNLQFTRVTAPVDGIAGLAQAQIGDLVGPATPELTMVSKVDPIKAYFSIPEQFYIQYMKQFADDPSRTDHQNQLEFELNLADGSVYPLKGKLGAVDRQVDTRTGSLKVMVLFPNPDNALRPGQFGRIRANIGTQSGVLVVPQRAVSELQGGYQLAVVGLDGKVEIRAVKVGERVGADWIVESGVREGELVVAEGLQKVQSAPVVKPIPFVAKTIDKKGI